MDDQIALKYSCIIFAGDSSCAVCSVSVFKIRKQKNISKDP